MSTEIRKALIGEIKETQEIARRTIDADYRGEVKVSLINHGENAFAITRGDRIAQMVINRICQVRVQLTTRLEDTARSAGGFGHTGA